MISSILFSFLVFLTYSEMSHIKLSAVNYLVCLNFVCKILIILCTAYFVFLYFYDFSMSYNPGHRHGKLFIRRPCKERADDLLKLSRHQLKMVVVILTGHAPVRGHLYTMGLFEGDPTCRFCRKETETVQHIICCCEALARQRYNVLGNPLVEPKDISTASVRDPCLFIRGTGLLNVY